MYIYIIVAVIIALILTTILFFALRSTVKRIDFNTRRYFVDKLQDYDNLIDEKKKILDDLNQEIEKNKKILSEKQELEKQPINDEKLVCYENSKLPKYADENLFKKYKNIKDKFSFDKEELINNFINNIQIDEEDSYNSLIILKEKFNNQRIYEIIKLRGQKQKDYLTSFLTDEEIAIIKKNINYNKFKVNDLIAKLDILIEQNDPTIYVCTGEKDKSYDYINPIIKTKYDFNINEGIKIRYKGKIYDYSL